MAEFFWQAGFGLKYGGTLSSSIFTRASEALAVKQPQSIGERPQCFMGTLGSCMQTLNTLILSLIHGSNRLSL